MVMLVVMLVLCGCGTRQKLPARKTDGKIKIGVSVYDQYDAFVAELMQDLNDQVLGAKAEEKQDIVLEVYNAAQSQTKQNEQVRDMIAADFDVICVNLVDRTAPTEVINAARDADEPFIVFKAQLLEDELNPSKQLIEKGAEACGVKLDRLTYAIANRNRAQAKTQMDKIIRQYGADIELVLANNDEMALGAIDAFEASDLPKAQRPLIFGIDGTEAGLSAVCDGKLEATIYNDAEGQAAAIFHLAHHLALEEPLRDLPLVGDKYIRLPYEKVTRDNVLEFK